jgi:hypothetical protein
MAPLRTRNLGSGIVVGSLVGLLTVLLMLPRTAWAADVGEESSKPSAGQAEDSDRPKDGILDKKPADEAVAAKKAQEAPKTPFYEKWQFWALTGGIVVGAIAAILVGQQIANQMAGGDARPCNPDFTGCFGDGQ